MPELETVMFPLNHTLDAKDGPEYDYRSVLELANERGMGSLCIKAFAKQSWPGDTDDSERPYETWYEPYDTKDEIQNCLRYTLSQGMTTIPSSGDPKHVPLILDAAQEYELLDTEQQERLREDHRDSDSPVPAP